VLIQFRVENHRSIRDEQLLSLVATTATATDRGDFRLLRPDGIDEALLPAIALYGANASGKSNVVEALMFMRDAVQSSHRRWDPLGGVPRDPFALSAKSDEASRYEVDFIVAQVRYRYGFLIDSARIIGEWLYAWPRRKKQTWFKRKEDAFSFGKHLGGENETIRGLTRPNSLFLSAAAQNNHPSLSPIYRWFQNIFVRRPRGRGALRLQLPLEQRIARLVGESSVADPENRRHNREALARLLQGADTGILAVRVDNAEGVVSSVDGRRIVTTHPSLHFRHKTESAGEAWLPLRAESHGTVTLLEMATSLLPVLAEGGVLCIDELEAGLHPMLALDILRLFQDPKHNPRGAQLIFTTHDTNLLGNVLGDPPLRRDQVWFTEKDGAGATTLYPLTDFHPRKEENLERGYLQGRYGAVPFLGELVADPRASTEK
jgi:uncharacterized protein